jgi:hypothetical protein
MTQSFDVDALADAIAPSRNSSGPSRRAVVIGTAWSIPLIATAMALPAYAASRQPCSSCVGQTGAPNCFLAIGGTGECDCPSGLVCVGTGPLGLVNVCVGTNLIPRLNTCGGTDCYGVCLSAGGTIPLLINTLTTAITSLGTVLGNIGGTVTGTTLCSNSTPIPNSWCVSPLNDGGLGTLCSAIKSCHTGTGPLGDAADFTIGGAITVIATAYNALISGLGTLGLVAVPVCDTPYVCTPFVDVAVGQTHTFSVFGVEVGNAKFGLDLYAGFCQCPSGKDFCYDNPISYPCTLA